jgi:PAS domain-containing protein
VGEAPAQRNLVLILARAFAAQIATAVFLLDEEGTIIYYNESAELLTGRPFIEGAGMTAAEWMTQARPRDDAGELIAFENLPLGITMLKREPAHGIVTFTSQEGTPLRIENATFPLFAHTEDYVGTFAIVWPLEQDRP